MSREELSEDNIFAPEVSDLSQIVSTFRNELNDCLRREEWNDAVLFQNGVVRVLNLVERDQTVSQDAKQQFLLQLAENLQPMIERHRVSNPNLAERYQQYAGQLREMAYLPG